MYSNNFYITKNLIFEYLYINSSYFFDHFWEYSSKLLFYIIFPLVEMELRWFCIYDITLEWITLKVHPKKVIFLISTTKIITVLIYQIRDRYLFQEGNLNLSRIIKLYRNCSTSNRPSMCRPIPSLNLKESILLAHTYLFAKKICLSIFSTNKKDNMRKYWVSMESPKMANFLKQSRLFPKCSWSVICHINNDV